MFEYVNLMIIKLLMMKLHAQLYIYICVCVCVCVCVYVCMYTLCFYSKLVEYDILVDGLLMNSYLIDVVVVMICCC